MSSTPWFSTQRLALLLSLGVLSGCSNIGGNGTPQHQGFEVKLLLGSALHEFCDRAAAKYNAQNPQLDDGTEYYITCEAAGSGDVVDRVLSLAKQLKNGTIQAEDPQFPVLLSVDGEIYHSQLRYQIDRLYPGQDYIPEIPDAPMLANSPMVLMAEAAIADSLQSVEDPFKAFVTAKNHQDLNSNAPNLPITYVHTAPTRSNSGLQTLVSQFASVSGKRPVDLTIADVQKYQDQVQQIQQKVTRYGKSTSSLSKAMVANGPYWASVGSVYESSVIAANSERSDANSGVRYQAVYPPATFTSNMRAILAEAPWISEEEKAAAEAVIEYLRSPETQSIATDLGLRPGVPGVPLGPRFSPEFGVQTSPNYDSYNPPPPEVVEAMLQSWQDYAKKASQVAVVVDSSGSMAGRKITAVQNTLRNYIENLGPKERIALINFNSDIKPPVVADGTPEGRDRGMQFITSLQANGGTRLYDAALYARNWLSENLRQDAINAVLILTDGEDSGSQIQLNQLERELQKSGFSSDQRIAFFTVGYGKEGEFDESVLKQIAEVNGGYYRKGDPETISALMADLQVEF
ncbi:extracellular solute-binding protein [Baaleninema sp.]|uniref:extracellular solute-binding protein n=1 Tax=Baaleninema sp. TaxID=3101197 RepID=UPI003CFDA027